MLEHDYDQMVLPCPTDDYVTDVTDDLSANVAEPLEDDDTMVELLYVSNDYGMQPVQIANTDADDAQVIDAIVVEPVPDAPLQGVVQEFGETSQTSRTNRNNAVQITVIKSEEADPASSVIMNTRSRSGRRIMAPTRLQPIPDKSKSGPVNNTPATKVSIQNRTKREVKSPAKGIGRRNLVKRRKVLQDDDEERMEAANFEAGVDGGIELPARDPDNDDWPAQETLDAFPKEILKNGVLVVKGKELMSIINK